MCLKCHGQPEDDIALENLVTIRRLYPADAATGLKLGDLREGDLQVEKKGRRTTDGTDSTDREWRSSSCPSSSVPIRENRGAPPKNHPPLTFRVVPPKRPAPGSCPPRLATGILVLHAVEKHRSFESGLIAEPYVLVLSRQLQKLLPDSPKLSLSQLWQFVNDFRCAHSRTLPPTIPRVNG
jgi:hypothetical protein